MSDRKFDGTRFEWVGSITEEVSTCVASSKSKVQSWKDMLDREFVVGGEGKDSDLDINANLLKNIFGAKIKLVSGYPGSTDVKLAIQRGEVDGICGLSYSTFKSNYATERREKSVNVLLQVSLKRHPELGEVPFVGDFATADQMSALRLLLEPQAMARPFAAPPGISKDRLRTLQAAFDRTMKDPAFLEDAQNIHLDVVPMRGEDVKALVSSLYSLPQEARDKARIATGG
jgi:tripartite-type tricarboxylate transporter receptor subunit TctC